MTGRALRRHYASDGATHDVDVALDHGLLRGHVDGRDVAADARVLRTFPGGADLVLMHDGGRARAVVLRDGDAVHVALCGRVWRFGVVAPRAEGAAASAEGTEPFVASPMTGVVRAVAAAPGKSFAPGETLVVVEAMKMEFAVVAPRAVVVEEVRAEPGDRVDIGAVLVTFRAATP
jgi:acetyl/propionyl-CoA carboxylase alpha subunit